MVNRDGVPSDVNDFRPMYRVVSAYVVLVVATLVALPILNTAAPALATNEAWGHAVVVAVFAILLPVRLRAAHSDRGALRAVAIIAGVLVAVNIVEAALPGFFPSWMRIEMVVIAALMLALVLLAVQALRRFGSG